MIKMKFILRKASSCEFEKEIEIKTIEDLEEISREYGKETLLIDFFNVDIKRITIYDDWIE